MRVRVRVRANLGHGDVEVVQAARQQPTLDTRLTGENALPSLLLRYLTNSCMRNEMNRMRNTDNGEKRAFQNTQMPCIKPYMTTCLNV